MVSYETTSIILRGTFQLNIVLGLPTTALVLLIFVIISSMPAVLGWLTLTFIPTDRPALVLAAAKALLDLMVSTTNEFNVINSAMVIEFKFKFFIKLKLRLNNRTGTFPNPYRNNIRLKAEFSKPLTLL